MHFWTNLLHTHAHRYKLHYRVSRLWDLPFRHNCDYATSQCANFTNLQPKVSHWPLCKLISFLFFFSPNPTCAREKILLERPLPKPWHTTATLFLERETHHVGWKGSKIGPTISVWIILSLFDIFCCVRFDCFYSFFSPFFFFLPPPLSLFFSRGSESITFIYFANPYNALLLYPFNPKKKEKNCKNRNNNKNKIRSQTIDTWLLWKIWFL